MQAFCDERGEALTLEEAGERLSRELELDKEMRMYHRRTEIPRCFCHCVSAQVPFPADARVIQRDAQTLC